jgi:hypothetical protein
MQKRFYQAVELSGMYVEELYEHQFSNYAWFSITSGSAGLYDYP